MEIRILQHPVLKTWGKSGKIALYTGVGVGAVLNRGEVKCRSRTPEISGYSEILDFAGLYWKAHCILSGCVFPPYGERGGTDSFLQRKDG